MINQLQLILPRWDVESIRRESEAGRTPTNTDNEIAHDGCQSKIARDDRHDAQARSLMFQYW